MTANTVHNFCEPRAITFLTQALTATGTTAYVEYGGAQRFIDAVNLQTGDVYATITDPTKAIEIVKITAISGNVFTIVRSQEGTSNVAWPVGSVIVQRLTAGNLDTFFQKGSNRTFPYNPNGLLTALYPGEKVYQTGAESCELKWWINITGTTWALLAGDLCEWDDGYGVGMPILADNQGYIGYYNTAGKTWAQVRTATDGDIPYTAYDFSVTVNYNTALTRYQIWRAFLDFDVSALNGETATDVYMTITGINNSVNSNSQILTLVEGTWTPPLAAADYDAFNAVSLGEFDFGLGEGAGYNLGYEHVMDVVCTLNASGIAVVQAAMDASTSARFVIREKYFDFSNHTPTQLYDGAYLFYGDDNGAEPQQARLAVVTA